MKIFKRKLAIETLRTGGSGFMAGVLTMLALLRAGQHNWSHMAVNIVFAVFFAGLVLSDAAKTHRQGDNL